MLRDPDHVPRVLEEGWLTSPIGVAFISADYRFLWINRELARMNGATVEDHRGQTLHDMLSEAAVASIVPLVDECVMSNRTVGPLVLSGPIDAPVLAQRHVSATYSPICRGQRVEAVAAYVRDVSDEVYAKHRAAALTTFTTRLGVAADPDRALHAALCHAMKVLGGSAAAFGEVIADRLRVVTTNLNVELLDRVHDQTLREAPQIVSVPLTEDWPLCRVAETGHALSFESVARACAEFPALTRLSEFTTHGAFCVTPVLIGEQVIGTFEVHWPTSRKLRDAECELVAAFGALAGQAIERTRFAVEQHRRGIRAEHRTRLADGLASARTPDQVAAMFTEAGLAAMGAVSGAIYMLKGDWLHALDDSAFDHRLAAEWQQVPRDVDAPIGRVLQTGIPETLRTRAEITAAYPHLSGPAAEHHHAWLTYPLRLAGDICGALTVTFSEADTLTPTRLLGIEAAVQLIEDALERTTEGARDRRIVLALQDRVTMGAPDRISTYQFGYRYRPADTALAAGGDWMHVTAVGPDGEVAALIGDVVGHGLGAVLSMTELRSACAALIAANPTVETFYERLSRGCPAIPGAFCSTLIYCHLEATGQVRFVRAGHPPPIAQNADGVRILEEPGQPPIGLPPSDTPVSVHHLAPDERLILYTDGLVERRHLSIDDGLERLAAILQTFPLREPPGQLAQALLDTMLPDEAADDAAILVIQRR